MKEKIEDLVDAIYLGRPRAGSKNWHKMREKGLGGSEIAIVMGLSPYKSLFRLWHEKAGNIEPGQMDENRSRIGLGLEDVAAKIFEDETGYICHKTGMYQSKDCEIALAEPDRLLTDKDGGLAGVLEIKTVDPSVAWQWGREKQGKGNIPEHYMCQVQWYLNALKLDKAFLIALIGFGDVRIYEIEKDTDFCAKMVEAGEKFIETLKNGEEPSIDDSNSTFQVVRELSKDIDYGQKVQVDEDLAEAYFMADEEKKLADKALTGAKARLIDALGGAEFGYIGTEKTFRLSARKNPKGGFYAPNVAAVRKAV